MAISLVFLAATSANASSGLNAGANSLNGFNRAIHAQIYSRPTLEGFGPSSLQTDKTKQIAVAGHGFYSNSQVLINGRAVPTTFQNGAHMLAEVSVPDNAIESLAVQVHNPSSGGGYSQVLHIPVQPKTIAVYAYNSSASDYTGTVLLGREVQFFDVITSGPGNADATWTLSGAGSLSSSGLYYAPSVYPSGGHVTITASLKSNPAVRASLRLMLEYPVPEVSGTLPSQLVRGKTNTVTITGSGFTPATSFMINGRRLSTTWQSSTSVLAQIAATSSGTVSLSAANPAPRGGTSNSYPLEIAAAAYASAQITDAPGHLIPQDFLGFSHEWTGISWMMGTSSAINGKNYIYRQLIRNLMNGTHYPFSIRIGGDSTDQTGEPNSQTTTPFIDLVNDMDVSFSLGVNMGEDNPYLAIDQAKNYVQTMPRGSLASIELGNEPDNYPGGARSKSYKIDPDYFDDFSTWANDILPLLPSSVKLMGPSWASSESLKRELDNFEQLEGSNVSTISQHMYGGHQGGSAYSSTYLLTPSVATSGPSKVAAGVVTAHQNGQLFRIGEFNSLDGGGIAGISDTFGSALWAIDTMFEYANVGVDGVNWHGNGGEPYCAFTFSNDHVDNEYPYVLQTVAPLYYGMLFFQQAASNRAQLLPVSLHTNANIKVWATHDQSGAVHVMIINKDLKFAGNIAITLTDRGDAFATRLTAPSYQAKDGVTLAGQSFDSSIDGRPIGTATSERVSPSAGGVYTVAVQPTSAVLLTFYQ